MDCDIIKSNIELSKTVIDGFAEEKVDFDIIIPDYCAAASKILKCDVIPVITTKTFESDRMIIGGVCTVNVIYADEESGQIRSISETSDFRQTYPIKESVENYRVKLKVRASGVVCRLQNSRRISVKSMIGIAVKVMGNYDYELITGFENCNTETKFENISYCAYVNTGSSDIHINGEMQTLAPVSEIIKYNSSIQVSDVKIIKDKAIIKGDAKITCLYTCGENISDLQSVTSVIPFSDVIEIIGADENSICDVSCEIVSFRCDMGNASEQNLINVEIEAIAEASIYQNKEIQILKDTYSRISEIATDSENLTFESLAKVMKFTDRISECVEVDIEDAIVDDIYAKPVIKNITAGDSSLIVEGELCVSVSLHNNEEYRMYDKTFSFKISENIEMEFSKLRCEADASCVNIDFSMSSDKQIDIDCDLSFSILVFSKISTKLISNVQSIGDKNKINKSKVVLYYADKGELLWDIAKKYSTSVDILKRDNNIENEQISENCMLLISNN